MAKRSKMNNFTVNAMDSVRGTEKRQLPAPQTPPNSQQVLTSADTQRVRNLEEEIASLTSSIPEGYHLEWVALDKIRLDREYDKEPIEDDWVNSVMTSIGAEGLKRIISLDGSYRVLSGQVRTMALNRLKERDPERFKERFPTGSVPVYVHDTLNWDTDPEACEDELLLLQRQRDMPEMESRKRYTIAKLYYALTDPRCSWRSGRVPRGMRAARDHAQQSWGLSERWVRAAAGTMKEWIDARDALGPRPTKDQLQQLKGTIPSLDVVTDHVLTALKSTRKVRGTQTYQRGWKSHWYHSTKSAESLVGNLEAIDSPLTDLARGLHKVLSDAREGTEPPTITDELYSLLQQSLEGVAHKAGLEPSNSSDLPAATAQEIADDLV